MTTPESPSALLERAAAALEQRAAAATSTPWVVEGLDDGESAIRAVDLFGIGQSDTEWIATLSPAAAPPLVEWLRETVVQYRDEHARRNITSDVLDRLWMEHPAVRFSRQILGEGQ